MLNVEQYCMRIHMCFSAMNNLVRSLYACSIEAGLLRLKVQPHAQIWHYSSQLPLYHTVRNLASMGHLAIKTKRTPTNRTEGLHFSGFHFNVSLWNLAIVSLIPKSCIVHMIL